MTALYFNIRFGEYHWQWGPHAPYFAIKHSRTHQLWRKSHTDWEWFGVYRWFGKPIN